jgi:hypothetical protein
VSFDDEILADEDRLAGANDVFGEVIPGGTRVHGLALAANHFEIEIDDVTDRIGRSDVEIFDIKQAAEFFPDFAKEIFLVKSGAEGAADFVEDVKLLGTAGSLLDEITVFNSHADLVAEGEKKSEFGGSEAAVVGSSEEKKAECLLFGLKADDDDAPEAVLQSEFAEAAKRLVIFERGEIVVAQIAEAEEAAEAGDEADEIVVEAFFLSGVAERVGNAGGDDGSGAGGVAVMEKEGAGRQADDAEDAVESLGEHSLNFAADETGSGKIEIGKREHIALDAAFFFLVDGHDEEHADEGDRKSGNDEDGITDEFLRGLQKKEGEEDDPPESEGQAEEAISKGFVMAAFVPEKIADDDVDAGGGNEGGDREKLESVGHGPESEENGGADRGLKPKLVAGVELCAKKKANGGETEERVIQGVEDDVGADPGRNSGAEIMESVEGPADGPVEKIILALERIDVGEEHSNEERSEKQAERDRVW